MKRILCFALSAGLWLAMAHTAGAQMIANKKLSASDLGAAQSEARSAGGKDAQLIYATRLDAVEKGKFDSLVVIYAKGKDTNALIVRAGKRYLLKADPSGQSVKAGDQFQRMGVRYEEGKAPVLRFFSVGDGGGLHSVDYRYNWLEFVVEGQ